MPLCLPRTRGGVPGGRQTLLPSVCKTFQRDRHRISGSRRSALSRCPPPPSWAQSPTPNSDGGFDNPCPDYLGTETLTLQKQRPFHHGPVHGPRRFLRRFLAPRAPGGAGRRAGRGGAGPAGGVPAPPRPPRTAKGEEGEEQEGRGGGTREAARCTTSRPLPLFLGGSTKWLSQEKTRGFHQKVLAPGLGDCATSDAQLDFGMKAVKSPRKMPKGTLGHRSNHVGPRGHNSSDGTHLQLGPRCAVYDRQSWGCGEGLGTGRLPGAEIPAPHAARDGLRPRGPSCAQLSRPQLPSIQPPGKESFIKQTGRGGEEGGREVEQQQRPALQGGGGEKRRELACEGSREKAECGRAQGDLGGTKGEGGEKGGIQSPLAEHFFWKS